MDYLRLALRSFDLDGDGAGLHRLDFAARDVSLRSGALDEARAATRRPFRCCTPMATAGSDEAWLGAEAMVDPACAAVLRGAARDAASAADPEWMPL